MEIIPVIDLKGGLVVRARFGERASYLPMKSRLCPSSDPAEIVSAFLSLHPFRTFYAADLDAIERGGDNNAALERVSRSFPNLDLWIDNGSATADATRDVAAAFPRASLVIGSESQPDCDLIRGCRGDPRIVLSLDFRGERFLGPDRLFAETSLWPDRVVVMTLARVGGNAGPDFGRFADVKGRAGNRDVYFAGGLRNAADLARVKASGAAGILVASALHDGRLSSADLAGGGPR